MNLPKAPNDRKVLKALRDVNQVLIIEEISERSGVAQHLAKTALRRLISQGRVEKTEDTTEYGLLITYKYIK